MSTVFALLVGCALHVGAPPTRGYAVIRVDAPVAEASIDTALRSSVEAALAARAASGSEALALEVELASWTPSRREGELVVYLAELRVRFVAGERSRSSASSTLVPGPGDAAGARAAREAAFADLAERVAADGVTWLLYGTAQ
ncbi:MAG: hypothetical protein FJ090_09700 [Deltaproteobacteria bacterium]|nr:hypothetical protein [Deltaproteobacteria bacterium]